MPPKFLRRSRVRTAGRCRKIRSRTEYPQLFHYSMNPPIEVSAGLVFRDGQLLITQRRAGSHLGGLWEFPGGKREAGETLEQCLARELREELGIQVRVGVRFDTVTHTYPEKSVRLEFFLCRLIAGEPQPLGCAGLRWIRPEDLDAVAFPPADARIERLKSTPTLWQTPA